MVKIKKLLSGIKKWWKSFVKNHIVDRDPTELDV